MWPNKGLSVRRSQKHRFLRGRPARRREAGLKSVFPIWDEVKLFMRWVGGLGCGSTGGAGFHCRALELGHLWQDAVKRLQHRMFRNYGPFTSGSVLAFRFRSCPGSLASEILVPCSVWGQNFFPPSVLRLHDLQFCSVVSEKQLSILLETGPARFGAGSAVTIADYDVISFALWFLLIVCETL